MRILQTTWADWLGPKVSSHLAPFLYSSREPSELLQWLCHDDSTIHIVVVIIIIIIITNYYLINTRGRLSRPSALETAYTFLYCIVLYNMEMSNYNRLPLPVLWWCLWAVQHDCVGQCLPTCCLAESSIQKPCSLQPISRKNSFSTLCCCYYFKLFFNQPYFLKLLQVRRLQLGRILEVQQHHTQ